MSTFLELAVKGAREAGMGGTGPDAVTGLSGQHLKLVNWIADSWTDLQNRYPNWRWMRCGFTVNTVASTDSYAYTACTDVKTSTTIARFARWWANDRVNGFNCYLTSGGVSGQYRLIYVPYEEFRHLYKFGVQQSQTGQPIHVAVDYDDQIVLGPNPNAIYTVTGDFQRGPQILAANGDTPDFPSRFHDLILWRAIQRYATHMVAPEILAQSKALGDPLLRELEMSQLPQIRLGGPMA